MKTFLILLASFLLINFSSVESKPHLTNFFMNMNGWNYQNGIESDQLTDTFPIESRTDLVSQRESGLHFTYEDFPESKNNKTPILKLVFWQQKVLPFTSHLLHGMFSKIGGQKFRFVDSFPISYTSL